MQQIKNITEPTLSVGVSNIFLPDSELQFALNARNVKRVDFALYKIDLTRDVRFTKNLGRRRRRRREVEKLDSETADCRTSAGQGLVERASTTKAITNRSANEVRIEGKLPWALTCSKPRAVRSRRAIWFWLPTRRWS